jgi:hypothetical protein
MSIIKPWLCESYLNGQRVTIAPGRSPPEAGSLQHARVKRWLNIRLFAVSRAGLFFQDILLLFCLNHIILYVAVYIVEAGGGNWDFEFLFPSYKPCSTHIASDPTQLTANIQSWEQFMQRRGAGRAPGHMEGGRCFLYDWKLKIKLKIPRYHIQ